MKYFLDTEFLEGTQRKRLFGIPTLGLRWDKNNCLEIYKPYTPNTIDLISIGIVAEDGREYYAISKDFNLKEAWNRFDLVQQSGDMRNIFPEGKKVYWIRENVLRPIYYELIDKDIDFHDYDRFFTYKALKNLIDKKGKTNQEIAEEAENFTKVVNIKECENGRYNIGTDGSDKTTKGDLVWDKPEFYAYYADYDWVAFCWLFGKMMDLPSGFPMYCKDLKQMLDENAKKFIKPFCLGDSEKEIDDMAERSIKGQVESFKTFSNYPKQDSSKSHNAIEDARWNKQLFEFLNTI